MTEIAQFQKHQNMFTIQMTKILAKEKIKHDNKVSEQWEELKQQAIPRNPDGQCVTCVC